MSVMDPFRKSRPPPQNRVGQVNQIAAQETPWLREEHRSSVTASESLKPSGG
jgi:hypothetical protein